MWLTLVRWIGAHRILLFILAAGLLLGGLAWSLWCIRDAGYEAGRAEVQARWDEAEREADKRARADERLMQRAVDAIGARLSADLSRLRIEHRTINRRIVDEVRSVPVYQSCILTDVVWRHLNQLRAATDAGAVGGGGAAVPAAGTAR
ncbi:MAG: hypothetical protein AB7O49_17260 [Sphingomonadales bacterium]